MWIVKEGCQPGKPRYAASCVLARSIAPTLPGRTLFFSERAFFQLGLAVPQTERETAWFRVGLYKG
jgi:hypothetical protein